MRSSIPSGCVSRILHRKSAIDCSERVLTTTFLRQLTQGRGYYTFEFVRYETLPQMLESKVIEKAKALGNFADED